ncbi:MAG: hypothetical protein QOC61_2319 [Acidobacteriota bacterium]|nr:hypothetical protein [Acidobacteriota bacterium]MDT5263315.1 hypothetical protein [Acidobacteriota bacterium]
MRIEGARGKTEPTLLAVALAGSWREAPPEPELTADELGQVIPLLTGSGAAALAWWKIRGSHLQESAPARTLRQSYHTQTLQAALQDWEIEHVFSLLRSARVEPILLKGWAAACLYPERGLRPPGDIDLCIRPERHEAAKSALWGRERRGTTSVDLTHDDSALSGVGGWEGLYARTRLAALGGTQVRVLGHEDQLRFLCLHLLRHSAYRPLWLCDVAAALEAARPDFDWCVALGGSARERNWVTCVLDLARRLLGARFDQVPEEVSSRRAPEWLVEEVLTQWERPCTAERWPHELMSVSLRRPSRVLTALLKRWPDPIRASVGLGLPFDGSPRLPRQLAFYLLQSARFLNRPLRRRGVPVKNPAGLTSPH